MSKSLETVAESMLGVETSMEAKLKQAYVDYLIQLGVSSSKAAQASQVLTVDDFYLISQICPTWASALVQAAGES